MTVDVVLGEVTCPSGQLVITDGGYLEMWSGDRVPADEEHPATDFTVVGPDAEAEEAYRRGLAVERRRNEPGGPKFAFDFRPHSHHWEVMRLVRASEHEAGVIRVADADILMAMTSVGDGFFPVHLDVDAGGLPVALRIDITGEDPR